MRMESAALTHVGRRSNNEDAFSCGAQPGLFAVADGMGGYEGGEVASRLAVESLERFVERVRRDHEATWPFGADPHLSLGENLLAVAVRLANQSVLEKRVGRLDRMGSTVAALLVDGGEAVIGHLGDSRVYRLRAGRLEQLTRDHSLYAELEASGAELPPREQYPYANVITRALGLESQVPTLRREQLQPGDRFLLCTDGLVERLSGEAIAALLAAEEPREACRRLVEAAYGSGARDNITCVVVRVC